MRRLTERSRVIGMLQGCTRQVAVEEAINVSQSLIKKCWYRHHATGCVQDRPRSGRPRTTVLLWLDRFISTIALINRVATANQIRSQLQRNIEFIVTGYNIRNRLHIFHLHAPYPCVFPVLRDFHIKTRLHWCRHHQRWDTR
jgi:hypothetical protein